MKKYIELLKSNKKVLYISIAILVLFVGVSFAYVVAQLSGGVKSLFDIKADTTDQLEFKITDLNGNDKDTLNISSKLNQIDFAEGKGNASDELLATARLKANSTKNIATYTYNVYVEIEQNEFTYTTTDKKPEMVLQVLDPNNQPVKSIIGLEYNEELQGFDITDKDDELYHIAADYEITSNSSTNYTEQSWNIKITFINLDTNQELNTGKRMTGKVIIQQKEEYSDIKVAVNNPSAAYGALANLNCTGADAIYDVKYNELQIRSLSNGKTRCTLGFTPRTNVEYLNDKIIGLAGTEQGIGQVVNEKGYRYEGKNPNNWVWFNNELWRIIGVFDSETHGIANTNLVKIIRANSIGGLVWNKSNTNDWSNSSLYNLLNEAYYNKRNANGNEYCYSYSRSVPGNCDYSNTGIDASYRNMIKEVTWKLGGHTTPQATTEEFYTAERGNATGNLNAYAATKSGYIGLMYPSDYGYSVLASSCARTTNLDSYNNSICGGQSWLGGKGNERTLSPLSSNSVSVFYVYSDGYLSNISVVFGQGVRPSLYLDSRVYYIDGTGSEADPYIIGM